MKGRAESYGHAKKVQHEGEAPTIGMEHTLTHSEEETEEGGKVHAERRGQGQQDEDDHGEGGGGQEG